MQYVLGQFHRYIVAARSKTTTTSLLPSAHFLYIGVKYYFH